jgi:hypothetical protein
MGEGSKNAETLRDGHYNKLEWRTCPRCDKMALVFAKGKGFCSRSCAAKGARPWIEGEKNGRWLGNDAGYQAMHIRVYKLRGKADHCSKCGTDRPEDGRYEWANLTGKLEDPFDYAPMCVPCHRRFDIDRFVVGEAHPVAKLTDAIVREIRRRYAAGEGDSVSMAREFGVWQSTIYNVITRKTWKHVA